MDNETRLQRIVDVFNKALDTAPGTDERDAALKEFAALGADGVAFLLYGLSDAYRRIAQMQASTSEFSAF
jgi:hypothetical protein